MTIDKAKLKALAEAFPDYDYDSNTEPFFNGPSGESLGGGSTGFYCVYGPSFEIDGDQYDGVTLVESCPLDEAKFICIAKSGILNLLAEIERLEAQVRLAGVSAEMTVHQEVGRAATETMAITAERDQLKSEVEALRKDAERYRWLRNGGYLYRWANLHPCDYSRSLELTDSAIDLAMNA